MRRNDSRSKPGFVATVTTVVGAPGQGKTTLLLSLLKERNVRRYIAIDPYEAIDGDVVYTLDQAKRYIDRWRKKKGDPELRLVYAPGIGGDPSIQRQLAKGYKMNPADYLGLCALSCEALLVVDEAHEFLGSIDVRRPRESGGAPALLYIARRGRHHGCGALLATQRPSALARDLTANSERFYFHLSEPLDLDYVRRSWRVKDADDLVNALPAKRFVYAHGRVSKYGEVGWARGTPFMRFTKEIQAAEMPVDTPQET